MRVRKEQEGFTLIELIIVLVLIGILAAVAIPRFANLQQGAQEAAVKGSLGNMRSAMTIFKAEQLAADPTATNTWPTNAQMTAIGTVLESTVPDMTFGNSTVAAVVTEASPASADVRDLNLADGGWRYSSEFGQIWANSSTAGGDGTLANMW